eukprot:scaffold14596_cov112-Isochrysis_galbana.AAC.2
MRASSTLRAARSSARTPCVRAAHVWPRFGSPHRRHRYPPASVPLACRRVWARSIRFHLLRTPLSERPGSDSAILDHRLPLISTSLRMSRSSSAVHASTSFFSRFSTMTDGRTATAMRPAHGADPGSPPSSKEAALKKEPKRLCASPAPCRPPHISDSLVPSVVDDSDTASVSCSEPRCAGACASRKSESRVRMSPAGDQCLLTGSLHESSGSCVLRSADSVGRLRPVMRQKQPSRPP